MQLNLTPPARMQYCIWCSLFSIGCMSREPYLSQTEQWWHRSGFSSWQRSQKRIAKGRTHPVQSHSSRHRQPPLTPTPGPTGSTGVKCLLFCSSSSSSSSCAVPYCTSRVGAGVDGQILGDPPQDLLLGLSPIFALQQLLVRVGQVELCGAERRGRDKQHPCIVDGSTRCTVYFE